MDPQRPDAPDTVSDSSRATESAPAIVKGIGIVLTLTALLLSFWTAYFPVRFCQDAWWHIKGGKVFYEHLRDHGTLPPHDLFTLKGEDVPWVNHEWLSELMMYGIYAAGGLPTLVAMKALWVALSAGFMIWLMVRRGCSLHWAATGALFAVLMSQVSLYLRPHLLTYGFILLWMDLMFRLKRAEQPARLLTVIVIVEILWINLHGGGILGILLTVIALMEEVWWRLTGAPQDVIQDHSKRFNTTLLCLGLVAAASLINPYGYRIHLLPAVVMSDSWLVRLVGELSPPDIKYVLGIRIVMFVTMALLLVPIRRFEPFELLALLFFTQQATSHVRHVPLMAIVAGLVLTPGIERGVWWIQERIRNRETLSTWLKTNLLDIFHLRLDALAAFLLVAYTMGWNLAGNHEGSIWRRNWEDRHLAMQLGYWPGGFPEGAVNYLLYKKLPGPIFHDDNFAGYLIYRLAPETMKVYTDSRYDLFGSVYAKEQLAVRSASAEPYGFYDTEGHWYDFSALGIHPDRQDERERMRRWEAAARAINAPDGLAWLASGKPYWRWVLDDKYHFNLILIYRNNDRLEGVLREPGSGWTVAYQDGDETGGYVLFERE